jgi:hypothetical protein
MEEIRGYASSEKVNKTQWFMTSATSQKDRCACCCVERETHFGHSMVHYSSPCHDGMTAKKNKSSRIHSVSSASIHQALFVV